MTPGNYTTPFYRGAAWSFTFRLTDTAGDPLDLTGLGPFTMSIEIPGRPEPLLDITGTGDYDATGLVTFSISKANLERLPLGPVSVGVRDNTDMPYMVGTVPVNPFPS